MPWLAVTLQNVQPVLEKLAPKYELKGIPHLVILDGDDATVLTLDGRTAIAKDPYGLEYPWRPRTLLSLLPKPLKRLLKAQLEKLLHSLKSTIRGALEGIAPGKVLKWFMDKVKDAISQPGAGAGAPELLKEQQPGGQGKVQGQGQGQGHKQTAQEATVESNAAIVDMNMDMDVIDVGMDGRAVMMDQAQDQDPDLDQDAVLV